VLRSIFKALIIGEHDFNKGDQTLSNLWGTRGLNRKVGPQCYLKKKLLVILIYPNGPYSFFSFSFLDYLKF